MPSERTAAATRWARTVAELRRTTPFALPRAALPSLLWRQGLVRQAYALVLPVVANQQSDAARKEQRGIDVSLARRDILGRMPGEALRLFTDASVMGQFVGHFDGQRWDWERSKIGPAMGAWIAWYGSDPARRPEMAGQAFLGKQGIQRAEYLAAIYGLHAVLRYARLHTKPGQVTLHVDNKTVANTLRGVWVARPGGLQAYDREASELVDALRAFDIEFFVEQVGEMHAQHRAAHRMSKNAWNHVFYEKPWRPARQPPPTGTRAVSTTRPGTEVAFTDSPAD